MKSPISRLRSGSHTHNPPIRNRAIMGECLSGFWLNMLGWAATAIMAGAAVALLVTSLS